MAYSIVNNTISLVRGDTFRCTVTIKANNDDYIPSDGDSIRFALKKSYSDSNPIILKQIPVDTLLLHLEPSDTKNLEFGSYVYDIELTKENGDVDTFIRGILRLVEEVH